MPLIDSSVQDDSLGKHILHENNFAMTYLSSTHDEDDDWETIETTIILGNGTKQSVNKHESSSPRKSNHEKIFSENMWTKTVKSLIRICCSKASLEDELSGNISILFDNVDHVSSRAFPITFLFINIMYWVFYVYIL